MKTIYVRVAKKGVEKFHRCGHGFTEVWKELTDVDDATDRRLREEQMLEVSDVQPAGFEPTAAAASALWPAHGVVNDLIVRVVGGKLNDVDLQRLTDALNAHIRDLCESDGVMIDHWIVTSEHQEKVIQSLNDTIKALQAELDALKNTSGALQKLPEATLVASGGEFDPEAVLAHAQAAISAHPDLNTLAVASDAHSDAPGNTAGADAPAVNPDAGASMASAAQVSDAKVDPAVDAQASDADASDVASGKRRRK